MKDIVVYLATNRLNSFFATDIFEAPDSCTLDWTEKNWINKCFFA